MRTIALPAGVEEDRGRFVPLVCSIHCWQFAGSKATGAVGSHVPEANSGEVEEEGNAGRLLACSVEEEAMVACP